MSFGARAQILFGIGEKVMRAISDKVGAADFGVGDAELWRALVGAVHELLAHELLCGWLATRYRAETAAGHTKQPARLSGSHG